MHVKNKDADKPPHLRRMTSAFIVHYLEILIAIMSTSTLLGFEIVSEAEQITIGYLVANQLRREILTTLVSLAKYKNGKKLT